MPRFLFNPTNHYKQTEGGDAVSSVINSTTINIANTPEINLGFIRKNTTDKPNGVAGLDASSKLIANLDWNKIDSGKPTTLGGYGINDAVNVSAVNAANGVAGLDANAKLNVNLDWSKVNSGKPTTLDGYGIADGVNVADINTANGVAGLDANSKLAVNLDWDKVTSGKPTTLAGYGIGDGVNVSAVNAANGVAGLDANAKLNVNLDWSKVSSGKPTTLNGYGISDAINVSAINIPNGVAGLDGNGKIINTALPSGTGTTINGPVSVSVGQVAEYKIVPYSAFNNYVVSTIGGTFTQLDDTIVFTVTASAGGAASITVNGAVFNLTISASGINAPTISSPSNGSSNIGLTPTFNSSQFSYTGTSQTQDMVRWELSTNSSFTNITQQYEGSSNLTSWVPTSLTVNTSYYLRVKHHSALSGWSNWSPVVTFTTVTASAVVTPSITSPSSNATNVVLTPTFTSSAFAYTGDQQTQSRVNWELATDSGFSTIVQQYEGVNNLTSWTLTTPLVFNTNYYVRVKHFSASGGWSEWSAVSTFKTSEGSGLTGSTTVYTNQVAVFNIADYVVDGVYTVTAVGGTVERVNGIVSFTVTASAGQPASITFNGQVYTLTVLASSVVAPNITSHSNNATDVPLLPSFTSSTFAYVGAVQTQDNVRWELATDSGFSTVVQFYEGASNLTGWSPATSLIVNLSYYVRVKYRSAIGGWSDWSTAVRFSTIVDSNITGPSTVYVGQVVDYTINSYSGSVNYVISCVGGTNTTPNSSGVFTFTVTASAGGAASITVNGTTRTLTVEASTISTPSVDSHSNPSTNVSLTPNFTSTAFVPNGATQSHDKTRWELATSSSFGGTVVQFSEDSSHLRAWTPTILAFNTDYYLRVRYHSVVSNWSEWSNVVSLHTLAGTAMTGPTTVYTESYNVYSITGYITGANYVITPVGGNVIPTEGGFVFTVTASAGGTASITLNGQLYPLTVEASRPNAPSITTPVDNDNGVSLTPTFNSSQFTFVGVNQSHDNTEWQLATETSFSSPVQSYTSNSNSTTWLPTTSLTQNTVYYARVRHHSAVGGWGPWSVFITFTTIVVSSAITGASTVYAGETYPYNIVDYNASNTYVVTCQGGTVTQSNGVISFIVSGTATAPVSITVNGYTTTLTLGTSTITTPTITPLANGGTNVSLTPTFTSSAFIPTGATQSQDRAEWELDIDTNFNPASQSYTATSNFTTWTPTTSLTQNTVYYVRVRYHSNKGITSDWSTPVTFTTLVVSSSITGETTVYAGETYTYNITGYSASNTYVVTCQGGTVSLATSTGVITFIVSPTATAPVSITVNGTTTTLTLGTSTITTPTVTPLANGGTNVSLTPTFTSSAFVPVGATQSQDRADWQLATDTSFSSPLQSYTANSNFTTWAITTTLTNGTTYHVRVRYHSNKGITSDWSTTVTFTTLAVAASVETPTINSPANNATGVSLTPSFSSSAPVITGTNNTVTSARWELATNSNFTTPIDYSDSGSNITLWTPTVALTGGTTYYVRVRYTGSVSGASAWSLTTSFTTVAVVNSVVTPTITSHADNATNVSLTPTFTSSAFAYTGAAQTQDSVQWNLMTDTDMLYQYSGTSNLTSWTPGILPANTRCYIQVKHHSAIGGWSQPSASVPFTTLTPAPDYTVQTPTFITPASGTTNVTLNPTFISSAFSSAYVGDIHTKSTWDLRKDSPTGSTVATLINSTTALTTWTPGVVLLDNTTYYVRVRYEGNYGNLSEISASSSFTTTTVDRGWVARIVEGPYSGSVYETFYDSAVDSSGNTYTVGRDTITDSGGYIADSAFIAKWSPTGTLLWKYRLASTTEHSIFMGITINSSNEIYAVGTLNIGSGLVDEGLITKWDTNGNLTWQKTVSQTAGETYNAVTCDASGNVYAVGFANVSQTIPARPFITKLNASGVLSWHRLIYWYADAYFSGAACDADGNLIVVGRFGGDTLLTYTYGVMLKVDTNGTLIWSHVKGASNISANFTNVTIAGSNFIYVTGYELNTIVTGCVLSKYNQSGTEQWRKRLDGTLGGWLNDSFLDVKCDTGENIYAVGRIYKTSNSLEGIITKWDYNGVCAWQRTISSSNSEELSNITINGNDHVSCGGTVSPPGGGYTPAVLKILKDMSFIPNGALAGINMTYISIGTSTLNTVSGGAPTNTTETITLSTVTYTMADRTLIKTSSDLTNYLSTI